MINSGKWSDPDAVLATDACLQGAGGTLENRYFTFIFRDKLKKLTSGITHLDAITMIIALKMWGSRLIGKQFIVKCDNETTVSVINKGRAHETCASMCQRDYVSSMQISIRDKGSSYSRTLPDLLVRHACMINTSGNLSIDKWRLDKRQCGR